MMNFISSPVYEKLMQGGFIPAHPLALNSDLTIDEESQRRLTRYYLASGVDGVAIGVHTTQFEIRDPRFNYYQRVLEITADELLQSGKADSLIKVAGICGPTSQAVKEAETARTLGYDLGLLSMGGLNNLSENELLERASEIAKIIPVFGFYLQPSVGGRIFSFDFWRHFCDIPNVYAIKTAPFNRYHTLDVVRAICYSKREPEIALYTGNDDNIVTDLITSYRFKVDGQVIEKRFVGALLGHYAVWTSKSVEIFNSLKEGIRSGTLDYLSALKLAGEVTDMNGALFDVPHQFKGSIAGIHEVLRRQGLMKGLWCLSPEERLSEGQDLEIDRVMNLYPHLVDDDFVREFLMLDGKV
ncbi:MAG: dihydrodipicolinate synthase family protein [Fermentimonas sp.]|jgi:dihydrodipicolinate synthase/N-acetylneuraminate lyase